jgi:hypothetical protein
MLEDAARTARRVLGSTHTIAVGIEGDLGLIQGALRARETSSGTG